MFDQNAVAEALHKAVETKGGDYVYEKVGPNGFCFYTQDGAPSCLVGWVVGALDPELLNNLAEFEQDTGSSFGVQFLSGMDNEGVGLYQRAKADAVGKLSVSEDVAIALQAAQSVQDEGGTWAQAQAAFDFVIAGEFPDYVTYRERAEYANTIALGLEWE